MKFDLFNGGWKFSYPKITSCLSTHCAMFTFTLNFYAWEKVSSFFISFECGFFSYTFIVSHAVISVCKFNFEPQHLYSVRVSLVFRFAANVSFQQISAFFICTSFAGVFNCVMNAWPSRI